MGDRVGQSARSPFLALTAKSRIALTADDHWAPATCGAASLRMFGEPTPTMGRMTLRTVQGHAGWGQP